MYFLLVKNSSIKTALEEKALLCWVFLLWLFLVFKIRGIQILVGITLFSEQAVSFVAKTLVILETKALNFSGALSPS